MRLMHVSPLFPSQTLKRILGIIDYTGQKVCDMCMWLEEPSIGVRVCVSECLEVAGLALPDVQMWPTCLSESNTGTSL